MAMPSVDHFPQLFPFCQHRLFRRENIQIPKVATFKIPVVSEGKSQEINTGSGLTKVYHLRFIPVQLQIKPSFNLGLDKVAYPAALIPGQYHKIIRIADDMRFGPVTGTVGRVKDLLEPVKVDIRQERRRASWAERLGRNP
jgi:hypothetical protein